MREPRSADDHRCIDADADVGAWIARFLPTLRRALVARNGLADGSDAAAEAAAWAWEHRGELAGMTNPAGYLYRVGQSSLRRRRFRDRQRSSLIPDVVARDSPPFDDALFAALKRLTEAQRVSVVMVHMYGFSYRDVADVLDVSEAAVTNHVHRGLARLRRIVPPADEGTHR